MVKLGPDCGLLTSNMGYSHTGRVKGFSHLHVSGTGGGPKYGNILVYPWSGCFSPTGYGAIRKSETAQAGYYSAELAGEQITAELTCTEKTGLHRYTFHKAGKNGILIDAGSFLSRNAVTNEDQELVDCGIEIISNNEIIGQSTVQGGWNQGGPYTVYFYALFDTPAEKWGTWKSVLKSRGNKSVDVSPVKSGAWFEYNLKKNQAITVKVGISLVRVEKAKANCMKEAGTLTFDQALTKAQAVWNSYLERIKITTDSKNEKIKFYTAIYHTLLQPSDRTGENPLWKSDAPYYDDFYAIWDTFRTVHPLMTLITPEKQIEIVQAMIDIYENDGYLPEARSGNYNGRTQSGSNGNMVIADAILRDMPGFNYNKALEAMLKDAEVPPGGDERDEGRGGLPEYNKLGYVSTNYERAGSRTLEYAANDWAIALCAKKLGRMDIYEKYEQKAAGWEKLWKPITHDGFTGFIMPKKADGSWHNNYRDPNWVYFSISMKKDRSRPTMYDEIPGILKSPGRYSTLAFFGSTCAFFYEGHSWTYSLYVPHDMKRLIEKCGGNETFISRLDNFFEKNYFDVTNEPGFLTPCLYHYAGRPDKTAEKVTKILNSHYDITPGGLPGNDDSGSLSSWYAFHTMGFYPNAGQDVYLITSPRFEQSKLDLGNGKSFTVTAENLSSENIYVISAELNGKEWNKSWFSYSDIKDGAELKLTMGPKPSDWGTTELPPSRSDKL
jgi:putative alpha-1,2-mannosidase